MRVFNVPVDNVHALERLNYEISKYLLKENSAITYDSPLSQGRTTCYAASPHRKSRSANVRRCDVIKKVVEMDNSVNEDDRDSFAHRTLQIIDNECNDEFFANKIKKLLQKIYAYCNSFMLEFHGRSCSFKNVSTANFKEMSYPIFWF